MYQHQLLTCQCNLFHCKFAQERHLYQEPPKRITLLSSEQRTRNKEMKYQILKYKLQTERAADGSDNIAIVHLQFLTTAAGVSPIEAPCSTSSSHCNLGLKPKIQEEFISVQVIDHLVFSLKLTRLCELCMLPTKLK